MEALKAKDQRKIAGYVRELYGLGSEQIVAERVVRGLQTLIDGNSAILCRIDARRGAIKILADSVGPELIQYQEPAVALGSTGLARR